MTTTLSNSAESIDATLRGLPALVENFGALEQVSLIAGLIVGLVLWLLGRRIARPAVAVSGLVIGGIVAAMALQEFGRPEWMLSGLIVGGLVCCVVAWMLFRVWMGLSCALMLALVAPALALIWQGQTPDVSEMEHAPLTLQTDADLTDETARREALWEKAQQIYEHEKQQVVDVWQQMGSATRSTVTVAAATGALAGLLIGLLLPYVAASLQSALVGAVLLFYCGLALAHVWMPDTMARLPEYSVRVPLLAIGLITLVGVGIQWTLSGRRADR